MGEGRDDRRREALLEQLRRATGRPLSLRELMQRAGLHAGERTDAKRALRALAQDGALVRDGKRFVIPAPRNAAAPAASVAPARREGRAPRGGQRDGILGT